MPIASDRALSGFKRHRAATYRLMKLALDAILQLRVAVRLRPKIPHIVRAAEFEWNKMIDAVEPLAMASSNAVGEIHSVSDLIAHRSMTARVADEAYVRGVPLQHAAGSQAAVRQRRRSRSERSCECNRDDERGSAAEGEPMMENQSAASL